MSISRFPTFAAALLVAVVSLFHVQSLSAATVAPQKAKPVVSILGDSYSTFDGYVPFGNAVWYETRPSKRPMCSMSRRPGGGN